MNVLLAAVTVIRALSLPPHATIEPMAPRAAIVVARDGTVAATVTVGGFATRAIVWNATGGWHALRLPAFESGADSVASSVAAFSPNGALLGNAVASYGNGRDQYRALRGNGNTSATIDFGSCGDPQHSQGPSLGGIYADGDLLATMQSPPIVDLGDQSGQLAPVVVRLRGRECTYLGNGTVVGAAGQYAAGFAGYVGNAVQAPGVVARQRFVALRWHGDERRQLGVGAALAVNASGAAAGADAPPGLGADYGIVPHARYWTPAGDAVEVAPGPGPSVAYAIDDRGRVAGVLVDDQGRHRAFLWSDGRLKMLDDIAHAPDWRFECAYAFTPDGGLAGIGVHQNRAELFVLGAPALQ